MARLLSATGTRLFLLPLLLLAGCGSADDPEASNPAPGQASATPREDPPTLPSDLPEERSAEPDHESSSATVDDAPSLDDLVLDEDNATSDRSDSPAQEYPTSWVGPRTVTVAPGVHVLGELAPSAVYVVETSDGVILIDSGVDESCRQLLDFLRQLSIDPRSIRYVLLTHAHYDHVFGAKRLRELSRATVCAGSADSHVLRSGDLESIFSLFPHTEHSGDPVPVDRELHDGDTITLGDVEIEVVGAAGHTPGSVCYLVTKNQQRILFSGDAIASLNYGPATYSVHLSPQYRGDAEAYLKTVRRFLAMRPPDMLLTGHPLQHRQPTDIQMNEHRWRELLEPARAELQQTVARHRQDGADFLDGVPKEILPGAYYLGDISNAAVYCFVTQQDLVLFNAPGGKEFGQFVQDRLAKLGVEHRKPTAVVLTSTEPRLHGGLASFPPDTPVIVSDLAVETLKQRGIASAISHQQLPQRISFPIQRVALAGHDQADTAFFFTWRQKRVAVTSELLSRVAMRWTDRISGHRTYSSLQPQLKRLQQHLSKASSDPHAFMDATRRLGETAVDVWLPTVPAWGQNANLYDDDWAIVLSTNRAAARSVAR